MIINYTGPNISMNFSHGNVSWVGFVLVGLMGVCMRVKCVGAGDGYEMSARCVVGVGGLVWV